MNCDPRNSTPAVHEHDLACEASEERGLLERSVTAADDHHATAAEEGGVAHRAEGDSTAL